MTIKTLFLIIATAFATAAQTSAKAPKAAPTPKFRPAPVTPVERYRIPDPESERTAVIMDFANAISGTDGTPQSIGRKVSGRPVKKPNDKQEHEQVLGF